ncbi:NAD dependent epimerase/dehydratase family protein-like protein [Patellaria atrata CBS 101060]|uniref:NAD dependent epimerase/dehydratase family protein-like protein n=1 Tax=Patellaria atrata CBS 101060 TaxID=1346257 RepID=A0A9P4SIQ7_9PEZI|nr:NAD dependent epimerase/dehydratase family protein-like protein [Patellaria atrata CBS 101060]
MAAVKKRLVVCGGNGFLGSRICRAAAARGWNVTSISRSGEPSWSSVTSSPEPPPWSKNVSWEKANILDPPTYIPLLDGADAVVHSMGILLEADYKGVLQGKESPINGLRRAFSGGKKGSQNPLERKPDEPLVPQEDDGQLTYEIMNRDSAITLAQESASLKVPTFLYISAAGGAPILPQRYLTTKRAAESTISSSFPEMRSIFIRPGFLYDSSRAFTIPMAGLTALGAAANTITGGIFGEFMGAAGVKPIKADTVADAVVEAIEDAATKGSIETELIEVLANRAWRRGML